MLTAIRQDNALPSSGIRRPTTLRSSSPTRACMRSGPPDQPLLGTVGQAGGRVFAELTRILTGVEIHPAAMLGAGLFIDHATGVVIGETAEVGDDLTIYHGVTLAAAARDTGKRHPTIGDPRDHRRRRKRRFVGPDLKSATTAGSAPTPSWSKEVPSSAVVVGVPGQVISRTLAWRGRLDDARPRGCQPAVLLTRVARLEALGPDTQNGQQTGRVIRPPEAGVWHGEDFSI